jgi:hypothetical protein
MFFQLVENLMLYSGLLVLLQQWNVGGYDGLDI